MKKLFALTAALALLSLGISAQAAITIATVPVGNLGNAADTSGFGRVGYNYNIGKYEVTAGQYTAFLSAKAATDTYGLYNTSMSGTISGSGITQGGSPGGYTYSVASAFVNRPVNYVNFWDSCRFANWLHNGQGSGDTETGAYTLNGYLGTINTITRNAGATWSLANQDEWYKAAYHKNDGVTGNYWLYATSSSTQPGRSLADVSGNNANYYAVPGTYPINSPYYTTVAGEFQNSASPYGTFDQAGNVREWNDTKLNNTRGLRGGSFGEYYDRMQSSNSGVSVSLMSEVAQYGFRVSEVPGGWQPVPEPSSIIALAGGLVSMLGIRRRRA